MHRVWNTQSNSLIVSKHVVTDEMIFRLKRQVNKESKPTDDCIYLNKPNELTNEYNYGDHSVSVDEARDEFNTLGEDQREVEQRTGRFPNRVISTPERYEANIARRGVHDEDTPSLRVALNSKEVKEWNLAIQSELKSLKKIGTWKLVDKLRNETILHCKLSLIHI